MAISCQNGGSEKNFERPTGIAVDELNQQAFVNDKANNNIQVFTIPDDPFASIEYTASTNNDNSQEGDSSAEKEDSNDGDKDGDDGDEYEDKDGDGDIDCDDVDRKDFEVGPDDPGNLDGDGDGTACES